VKLPALTCRQLIPAFFLAPEEFQIASSRLAPAHCCAFRLILDTLFGPVNVAENADILRCRKVSRPPRCVIENGVTPWLNQLNHRSRMTFFYPSVPAGPWALQRRGR